MRQIEVAPSEVCIDLFKQRLDVCLRYGPDSCDDAENALRIARFELPQKNPRWIGP